MTTIPEVNLVSTANTLGYKQVLWENSDIYIPTYNTMQFITVIKNGSLKNSASIYKT